MSDTWSLLLEAARDPAAPVAGTDLDPSSASRPADPLLDLFRPILDDRVRVVAHLAQSLDGRIALPDGRSRWISGEEDLVHTHRLRALCDAVLVGAHTVEMDDPQLTVRHVPGPSPVRVVIDPEGRLKREFKVFTDGEAPTWRVTTTPTGDPDEIVLRSRGGVIDPRELVVALQQRGMRRLLVEGGGVTVSRFVAAGAVDRLHLVIAPVLVGAGRPGLCLPEPLAATLGECPRPPTRSFSLGRDLLIDCALH